jgi:uncharacterized protein YegJ (DUF2314 family)
VVQPEGHRPPWIVWCEPAKPLPQGELADSTAERCRWVVGVETMLDAQDPLSHFLSIMRTLCAAMPECPGIIDVNSTHFHPKRVLEEMFGEGAIEPPAEILWTIHAVSPRSSDAPHTKSGEALWLHTHGLWRCGRPELEMIGVPAHHGRSAANLVNSVAELFLETAWPEPGAPFEIGSEMWISLQPWQMVAPQVEGQACGGMADRTGDAAPGHTGTRAVICSAEPQRMLPNRWVWPKGVVEQLDADQATIYRTTRATERQAAIARSTWPELATAFAAITSKPHLPDVPPPAVVVLKVGFHPEGTDPNDDRTPREHLWFEIKSFDRDRAHGELINAPQGIPQLHEGDIVWLDRDRLSDWRVLSPRGSFGPHQLADLWRMIDGLAAST